ncbi:MAG: restriction endonuclease subunit S [Acidobacteria bacterium]|nr:restriction endonuclease subunit S [Acidobacteriota bacterium]
MSLGSLGEMPIKRLRFLTARSQFAGASESAEVTFLPMEAIGDQGDLDLSNVRRSEDVQSGYSRFRDGDVVIAKITPCFENGKGALIRGTLTGIGYGTTELHVLTPGPEVDGHFLYYVTMSPRFRNLGQASMTGAAGQQRVSEEFVRDFRIPVPPLSQQRAIANYLDCETSRLDALVAAKERLLELLAEKRRALITRAVTRGLDPCATLRDSGLPWLGKIPAHWKLVPLRFLVEIFGGATPNTGNAELWDGEIPWVSPKDMKQIEIGDAIDHVTPLALSSSALRLIEDPVVLIVVRGMILAHSFPTAVTTRPVTINQDMKALRCREFLAPHFLRDFFRGLENQFVSLAEESAHGTRKLESEVLSRYEICVPPLDEQHAIVSYISEQTANLEALTCATERTITLLKARRTALIAAAVTGKIDVEGPA